MLKISFVSFTGHEEKEYDPENPKDVSAIKKFFDEKLAVGFRAFVFPKGGGKPTLLQKFDEAAERIVLMASEVKMVAPVTGG